MSVLGGSAALAVEKEPAKAALSRSGASAFARNAALPKWASALEAVPPTSSDEPVVVRLAETQYWTGTNPAYLVNRAVQVNSASRLGELGQFSIPFVPAYQKLVLHKIAIVRGGQVVDRTLSANVRVLDSETDAQKGVYVGAAVAMVLLDDVKPGDTLWTVYSVEGNNPVFGNAWTEHLVWTRDVPVELRKMTLHSPANRPVQWRVSGTARPSLTAPVIEQRGGVTSMVLRETALAAEQLEAAMPPDAMPVPVIDMSEYKDWSQVAQWAVGLFPDMAKQPEVQALARRFDGKTSEQRAAQALHWVQDEIRYFSVSMGENSHRPAAPETVLKRRFGDCKDKSQLLVSLLRAMGIEAQPVLLHATAPKLPAQMLPAPSSFNHAIVRLVLDGKAYFVDPTLQNERGPIAALPVPVPSAAALIVSADSRGLVSLPEESLAAPQIDRQETIVIATLHGAGQLQQTSTYRGRYAASMRQAFQSMGSFDIKKAMLEQYEKTYPGVQLLGPPQTRDVDDGAAFVVEAKFSVPNILKEEHGRFLLAQRSQVLDGTLGIPDKLVRTNPLWLAAGRYRARYSLDVTLPAEARLTRDDSAVSVENNFFKAHGQLTWRGAQLNYFIDYTIAHPEVAAADVPALARQVPQLDQLVEAKLQFKPMAAPPQAAREASLRVLDIMEKIGAHQEVQDEAMKTGKVPDLKFDEKEYASLDYRRLCDSLADSLAVRQWNPLIGAPVAAYYKLVQARADAQTRDLCGARFEFTAHNLRAVSKTLLKVTLPDDDSLVLLQAWADFHAQAPQRAQAQLTRFLKARAAAGTLNAGDALLALSLSRRLGLAEPAQITAFEASQRALAWPSPLFGVARGTLSEQAVFALIAQLPPAAREYATMEAHFFLSQAALAAKQPRQADSHLNWLARYGQVGSDFEVLADADQYYLERNDPDLIEADLMLSQGNANGALRLQKAAAERGVPQAELAIGNRYIKGRDVRQEVDKGIAMLESAAAKGNSDAMNDLGVLYANGVFTKADHARAVAWYRKGAANGNRYAAYNLGHAYWFGHFGLPRDFAQAFTFLRDAAELGSSDAQFFLSRLYYEGKGTEKNDVLARFWASRSFFQKDEGGAAQLGLMLVKLETDKELREAGLRLLERSCARMNQFAIVEYSRLLLDGEVMTPDPEAAYRLLNYADVVGNDRGAALLGKMIAEGVGVRADRAAGLALLEKMEKRDIPDALYYLGQVYAGKAAGLNDKVKAAAYYRRGAQAGQREAAEALALMLHTGDGIPVDLPEAVRYYEMAVQAGRPRAMNNLANMYEEGKGVPKDPARTMTLYRDAARLGHPIAMLNIAELYENGAAKEAYLPLVYYMLADRFGQAEAQAAVQRLTARADPAAVEKARAYTLAWKPGNAMPEES